MKKTLMVALAFVLVIAMSVAGTFAYLTAKTEAVVNTFTVGKVAITLDEQKVTPDGTVVTGEEAARVLKNDYKLIPGSSYTKDPTVHFAAGSEASYLFVKVENGIANIESKAEGYTNIDAQIKANGWAELTGVEGVTGVYYKTVNANTGAEAIDYPVFANFAVGGDISAESLATYDKATITVTAYAIQQAGFETAAAAWAAGNFQ